MDSPPDLDFLWTLYVFWPSLVDCHVSLTPVRPDRLVICLACHWSKRHGRDEPRGVPLGLRELLCYRRVFIYIMNAFTNTKLLRLVAAASLFSS